MELPLPSVTRLPMTPEPVATLAATGGAAFVKLMVLPLTFRVEPCLDQGAKAWSWSWSAPW